MKGGCRRWFHPGATRPRDPPWASHCDNKGPCSWRRARGKREAGGGGRLQTTWGPGRGRQSVHLWPAGLSRGHDVPFPTRIPRTRLRQPRRTNPSRAEGAVERRPSCDEDPPSYPKATRQGAPRRGAGPVRSSRPRAVQVLASGLELARCPAFSRPSPRPLKNEASSV